MTGDPTSSPRRLRCLTCGAHALVRASEVAGARCEVCGAAGLEPVEEPNPAP